MKKSNVSIDSSCLIAIQADEKLGNKLTNFLKKEWNAYVTEIAILETFYVLCRKSNWKDAKTKTQALRESNIIQIEPINKYLEYAAKLKCERPIAIADCLTISLAKSIQGQAIFYHQEQELKKTLESKPMDVEIIFFKDL